MNSQLLKRFRRFNGNITILLIPAMLILLLLACKKSNVSNNIPNVSVQIYIPLSLPEYSSLNSPGNSITVSGGYKGIIVYRMSMTDFRTYDRACPYDPQVSSAIVDVDTNQALGVDRLCGSRFFFSDGSVYHSPATSPLKQYAVDYDQGSQTLYIHN